MENHKNNEIKAPIGMLIIAIFGMLVMINVVYKITEVYKNSEINYNQNN
jgi:hypothetical protein